MLVALLGFPIHALCGHWWVMSVLVLALALMLLLGFLIHALCSLLGDVGVGGGVGFDVVRILTDALCGRRWMLSVLVLASALVLLL